jgi:hypothetical protein
MSLLTPEEEYIQHMVKQMRAWQSANGHTLWMPSLHHLQGHQGLPSRRAIQSHLGSSERVYQLWLEHGLISAARHAELMLQIVPAHAKASFEEFFLARCRQWQQRNGRPGWMPVISHFNKYPSLPSTRAIRSRYPTSLEVYDLFYREGLITQERYEELRLISEMKTNAVLARKGRQNDLGRNPHNSQQAAD